jgi:uncharacterized protein YqjF (DUF2071 family)
VVWPLIYQRWRTFTFLHWAYDPADVQRLLPSGLDVHTYDGVAWVGLTPFLLCDFRPPGFPVIPGLSTVLGARACLRVPYHWAAMTVEAHSTVTYRSRRRHPPAAGHHIVAEPGSPLAAEELGERDHFLTGRWRAFTRIAGCLVNVPVEHQAWPLRSVQIQQLDQDLLVAAGLPTPGGQPVAHYSPGVDVRFGPPRR